MRPASTRLELTRTPRGLRWVRTGYAYQPPALCTYRTRRAACPQGPTYCAYRVRVTASAVLYVPWQPRLVLGRYELLGWHGVALTLTLTL